MLPEWELWACANQYVVKHGEDAPIIVAMRADELLDAGDFEGARNYQEIILRINRLLEAPTGTVH